VLLTCVSTCECRDTWLRFIECRPYSLRLRMSRDESCCVWIIMLSRSKAPRPVLRPMRKGIRIGMVAAARL